MTEEAKKKTKKKRPAERTLEWVRRHGALAEKVERWNPYAGAIINGKPVGKRQDMFGFVDVEAVWETRTDYLQACGTDLKTHVDKIRESLDLRGRIKRLLANHPARRLFIIAWRPLKPRGAKIARWHNRIIEVMPGIEMREIDEEEFLTGSFHP